MTKVDLITGFLGAGKTTFLARYGEWLGRQGCRFTIIGNEFGGSGIDHAVLQERFGGAVNELSGGCICCTLKAGFHSMLARLAGHCERILVEPSGLFDMDDFFEILDTLEREGLCEPGMCLTLIDPHSLDNLPDAERLVLRSQLTGTGAVLWTHADLDPVIPAANSAERVLELLDLGETLSFYPLPSHQLTDIDFAALQQIGPVRRTHQRVPINHQMLFQSTILRPSGIFDPERLQQLLCGPLRQGMFGTILRLKGFVSAEHGSLAVNYTPSGLSVTPCSGKRSTLNIIGHSIDRGRIKNALQQIAV